MAKGSGKNRKRQKTRANVRPEPPLDAPQQPHFVPRKSVSRLAIGAGLLLLLMMGGGLYWFARSGIAVEPHRTAESGYVGSETCSGCHQAEAKLWRSSQHRRAMDHATDQSVRGDFNDATFEHAGTRSRLFREGKKFLVETDGPDGKLATFEVKYTFGIDPLQQYLIEFPDGRVQALSIAWDTRPKDQGGQRWFHLYANEAVTSKDPLHWTKLSQNWNFMCAECHSTGVHKNYDAGKDRFATTFTEISVGCEGCHGAGARHVGWARQKPASRGPDRGLLVRFDERTGITWLTGTGTLTPKRSAEPPVLRKEVETCGRCHARRGQLSEDWTPGRPLSDTHRVSLLDQQRFYADGQMRDDEETYNYAPFKQSKMFARGVTCSDCHEPHSAALKAPGDGVCAQCHAPAKYESAAHRHHADVSSPPGCPSCHMPERRYMVVDRRHDHGFRIPRPDLSESTGTPNACNDCHRDKTASWAAQQIEAWFGPVRHGYQAYAPAFHTAWSEAVDAQTLLAAVAGSGDAPGIVRASALATLPAPDLNLIRRGLSDSDPLVRLGALDALEGLPTDQLWALASAQLTDQVRGVRIRAAELLAFVPVPGQPAADRDKFAHASAEFVAAQTLNADRPGARTALANFLARQGRIGEAEAEYQAALRLDASFSVASINLSDLYRQLGRDSDGERVLRAALATSPRDASLHHALGLALVRLKRNAPALDELRQAASLDPSQARYAYVYAVGLHSAGRRDDALAVLRNSLQLHPNDRDVLSEAFALSRETGDTASALVYAERLSRLTPGNRQIEDLIKQLKQ
ncbi:cytochrome c3 family protein [Bradyrhizobium stylosanthis]|uniref:Putative CXXCH cytochrome family protein n=1 Tax=Bradyrhizobium stylosanthis TaxID=1803665 RepID=A0A560DQF5_9BRAD|nr:tetratricopeptide repeat protein [Bradyrhizobium stylosanthis]TWA99346.1 putative CXXCH cytochrome family protein [Bradyrhizobium stylosanthis]